MMIQLTEEQVKALKALAKARKMPVAKLVRESVAAYVSAAVKDPERMKKKRRALAGLEKIRNAKFRDIEGKKDLAVNHDKYLEDIYAS
ncbi:MAG: ribbon-helix-helix protein, CopG family [Chloroflexota bacterium]